MCLYRKRAEVIKFSTGGERSISRSRSRSRSISKSRKQSFAKIEEMEISEADRAGRKDAPNPQEHQPRPKTSA
jgi:hypothetical protein